MTWAMAVDWCQWGGAIAGVAGAWGVGSHWQRMRFWGFSGFVTSNVLLITAFSVMGSKPLVAMQIIYLVTSIRGMLNNHVDRHENHDQGRLVSPPSERSSQP